MWTPSIVPELCDCIPLDVALTLLFTHFGCSFFAALFSALIREGFSDLGAAVPAGLTEVIECEVVCLVFIMLWFMTLGELDLELSCRYPLQSVP